MVNIDKSQLNVKHRDTLPYGNNLLDFAYQVALAKPLCKLVVDENCLDNVWKDGKAESVIYRIKIYENGEELGFISTGTRYLAGNKEEVYGVGSFRIRKERGGSATLTKDIKVALRTVKRMLVSRVDNELVDLIKNKVDNSMIHIMYHTKNNLRWDIDSEEEVIFYAMQAYHAKKRGEDKVSLPSKLVSVKDDKTHQRKCEEFEASSSLELAHHAKTGYGVMVNADGGYVVYDYALGALEKYPSFYGLPIYLQEKLGIFKLLNVDEPVMNVGCKFDEGMFYIYPKTAV
jgi:hypothetical protein